MPYDDRTAYRLVFDDNGADMMTPGPGWCRASRVVRVEPDTGVRTSTMEGGLFRFSDKNNIDEAFTEITFWSAFSPGHYRARPRHPRSLLPKVRIFSLNQIPFVSGGS